MSVGMKNGTAALEKPSGSSSKGQTQSNHMTHKPLLGTYLREMKTCPRKNLCMSIHSNIIHTSPKQKKVYHLMNQSIKRGIPTQ